MEHGELAKAVRVTVPVSVAGSLDKFQGIVRDALGQLGCQACCSGFDILIRQEREFFFDKQRLSHAPRTRAASGPVVTLGLSHDAGGDIKSVFKGIEQLADRLGCRACCSGFDLLLRHKLDLFTDQAGKLREFTGVY